MLYGICGITFFSAVVMLWDVLLRCVMLRGDALSCPMLRHAVWCYAAFYFAGMCCPFVMLCDIVLVLYCSLLCYDIWDSVLCCDVLRGTVCYYVMLCCAIQCCATMS